MCTQTLGRVQRRRADVPDPISELRDHIPTSAVGRRMAHPDVQILPYRRNIDALGHLLQLKRALNRYNALLPKVDEFESCAQRAEDWQPQQCP